MSAFDSITLINGLDRYLSLLSEIEARERVHHQENGTFFPVDVFKYVSLEYNTITAELNYKNEKERSYANYFRATFTIEGQHVSFTDPHCEDPERADILRNHLQQHMPAIFPSSITNAVSKETEQYLAIADEIAKQAHCCSYGDDYRPGFFSKIIVTDTGIALKQINHWNARSLDHKTNYHLRNLEFRIPTGTTESSLLYNEERIGRMSIFFSDRSSANNKVCGDKIAEKIQEQKSLFGKEYRQ